MMNTISHKFYLQSSVIKVDNQVIVWHCDAPAVS